LGGITGEVAGEAGGAAEKTEVADGAGVEAIGWLMITISIEANLSNREAKSHSNVPKLKVSQNL
jgi:hypothetical protein